MLIVCDVLNPDGTPHDTNTRAKLVELLTPDVVAEQPLYGFEQVRAFSSYTSAKTPISPCSDCLLHWFRCACPDGFLHQPRYACPALNERF